MSTTLASTVIAVCLGMRISKLSVSLIFSIVVFPILAGAVVGKGGDGRGGDGEGPQSKCGTVILFPGPDVLSEVARDVLPEALHSVASHPGLKHLVDLAFQGVVETPEGRRYEELLPDELDHEALKVSELASKSSLQIPGDFLTSEELEQLKPRLVELGVEKYFEKAIKIPLIEAIAIPKLGLHKESQVIAATAEGVPVMLSQLPDIFDQKDDLEVRADAAFMLAGLAYLSSQQLLPKLLAVTRVGGGKLQAVFALPAGYVRSNRRGETVKGMALKMENSRVLPFEHLLMKLASSGWPLLNLSVDFAQLKINHPRANIAELFEELLLPIFESTFSSHFAQPYLFPDYLVQGSAAWLPKIFTDPLRSMQSAWSAPIDEDEFPILIRSKDLQLSVLGGVTIRPMDKIKPHSTFGRITLLRFKFLSSLEGGDARFGYLDFVRAMDPQGFDSLLKFTESFARHLGKPELATYIFSYKVNKRREGIKLVK